MFFVDVVDLTKHIELQWIPTAQIVSSCYSYNVKWALLKNAVTDQKYTFHRFNFLQLLHHIPLSLRTKDKSGMRSGRHLQM